VVTQVGHSEAGDTELLRRAAGEPDAFGAFYVRFQASALAIFYRATGRADLTADLTAETFAQALASRHRFDPALGSARA
jgi:DNA-directed RNA polymerase specialized sigma24 family protein